MSVGEVRERPRRKKLGFELKSFRKITDLSVGAGRERAETEKLDSFIENLEKNDGFERRGGSGATGDGKSLEF